MKPLEKLSDGFGCGKIYCRRKGKFGWLQYVIVLLSFALFAVGCTVIGYMAWVLSTSVTITRFVSGSMLVTYSAVTLGFMYFFSGLMGWTAAFAESYCLLRMFLVFLFVLVFGEIAAVLVLIIMGVQVEDLLRNGWTEVNQLTRNYIQSQLQCCGYSGPKEFAYTSYPVDDSCYELLDPSGVYVSDSSSVTQRLRQNGCGQLMLEYLETHKSGCVVWLACLVGVQLLTLALTIYLCKRRKKPSKMSSRCSARSRFTSDSPQLTSLYD